MKKNEKTASNTVKEEVKVEKVKKDKKSFKFEFNKKIVIGIVIGLVIIIGLLCFLFRTKVDTITKVKKVVSAKYYEVECLTSSCDYIVASKGNKLGKYTTYVYDANGKEIARYKDKYNTKKSYIVTVFDVAKNYIIFRKVNKTTGETEGYIISTPKGKNKYSTGNALYKVNDSLVSEYDESSSKYLILSNKGKILYDGVNSINEYADGKIVALNVKNNDILINENGENILNGYIVSKEVVSSTGETLYLILSDSKANAYYYYNINNNKIVGDGFNGYTSSENDGELIITRRENNSSIKYKLSKDGKQTKISDETVNERVAFIKEKIGSDYALYVASVVKADQRYVFVNKIKDSSFGVYDVDSGKYTKLYNYSADSKATSIYNLDSNDNGIYMQTTCSKGYCDKNTLYVYDLQTNKQLFSSVDDNLVVQKYAQYTNGYKVIRYSSSSDDEKYQGKYVLFDGKNKEVLVSSNIIIPVGEENLFGEVLSTKALILYSTKDKKALNTDDFLGSKINVKGTYIYKFSDSDNTYLYSNKGKKLVSIKISDAKLIYSDETIVYILNGKVNIVDPTTGRTRKYRLKKDEKINDLSGDTIPPYRNSLFINNTVKDYAKVVNVKGRTIKKINDVEIREVVKNEKTNNIIIIVRTLDDNNNKFGLYIAK